MTSKRRMLTIRLKREGDVLRRTFVFGCYQQPSLSLGWS